MKKKASLEDQLEELTRELQRKNRALEIEAALEKVRARTISMRGTSELSETSTVLFQQLKELNIQAIRTGVGIFDDPNQAMELWVTTGSGNQEVMQVLDYFSLHIHPVFSNIIPARQQNKPYVVTMLQGEQVREYYQTMSTYLSQPLNQVYHSREFFYSFFFSQGTLNVITSESLSEEECIVMVRFASVFGLIYTRFLDLQNAEIRTREALRQSSLERVRAEIASMRTTNDLQRITPLIWQELTSMGVPFFRCGVFIVDDHEKIAHMYFSTPEGKSLATLHLPFEIADFVRNAIKNWRLGQVYIEQWDSNQFRNWIQLLLNQGYITASEQYLGGIKLPDEITLQFVPFSQGMLYVSSADPLEEDQIGLVNSLADAFSVAYARYEDFTQLEEAKNRVEATLAELKATQSQLIQSEKMASLGELTAGIAHEIQNPLNFVNNFSELNAELLDELQNELASGNTQSAMGIASSIKENEEKINHHGKRADVIVKGMLAHSRTSSGQKELTDINALCEEYVRLAFHGFRAKEKTFAGKFETQLDPTLPKINVVTQDIGRVILNLINNAFYSVSEKAKQATSNYEPLVQITTRTVDDRLEVEVGDNGNGISDAIKEKIFQPFFTTKPTGQGTGLGLSLSYEIVTKGHGGQLKVESVEGNGCTFVVQLPLGQG
jgi:signal transduction histidine kinase